MCENIFISYTFPFQRALAGEEPEYGVESYCIFRRERDAFQGALLPYGTYPRTRRFIWFQGVCSPSMYCVFCLFTLLSECRSVLCCFLVLFRVECCHGFGKLDLVTFYRAEKETKTNLNQISRFANIHFLSTLKQVFESFKLG